jgi:hypothetical protein
MEFLPNLYFCNTLCCRNSYTHWDKCRKHWYRKATRQQHTLASLRISFFLKKYYSTKLNLSNRLIWAHKTSLVPQLCIQSLVSSLEYAQSFCLFLLFIRIVKQFRHSGIFFFLLFILITYMNKNLSYQRYKKPWWLCLRRHVI